MDVAFTLYKGFLIAEYSETNVRAYRSRAYYADNTMSYETSSQANISLMIDEAGDEGDFTELEYYTLMQDLGRTGHNISDLEAPEQKIHQWGADSSTEKTFVISWSGSISWLGKTAEDAIEDFKANKDLGYFVKEFSVFKESKW